MVWRDSLAGCGSRGEKRARLGVFAFKASSCSWQSGMMMEEGGMMIVGRPVGATRDDEGAAWRGWLPAGLGPVYGFGVRLSGSCCF